MLAYYNPIKPNLLRAIPPSQKTILQIQATNWRRAQATMQRLKKGINRFMKYKFTKKWHKQTIYR